MPWFGGAGPRWLQRRTSPASAATHGQAAGKLTATRALAMSAAPRMIALHPACRWRISESGANVLYGGRVARLYATTRDWWKPPTRRRAPATPRSRWFSGAAAWTEMIAIAQPTAARATNPHIHSVEGLSLASRSSGDMSWWDTRR